MQVEICPEIYNSDTIKSYPDTDFFTKINDSIKVIVEKEGLMKYNVFKRCISTNGGNYLGELYEIDVKGKCVTGDKELNIFVKKIIDDKESIKVVSVTDAYKTELFVYKQLAKIFEELQDEAKIPSEERYKMVKILDGTDVDMMVMENLSKKGYKTYHRMDVVSLKFLELSIKNIARFHGLSFVLKEKYPEYFNRKIRSIKIPYIFSEEYEQMVNNMSKITLTHVDEHLKEKVEKVYENVYQNFKNYVNDESIKVCLCHGDYRPNNIMMKEENGEVHEVISIDYQLNHYGCPAFDLLFLIYFCTERDFRKSHMSNLISLYYDTLEKFLNYFDLDANIVYPRKEFESVFKEKMDYGMLIALQLLPFMFASDEDVPDIAQVSNSYFVPDSRFKERMQGIIEDFIELGFI